MVKATRDGGAESFGNRLRRLRQEKKMSTRVMAAHLGVSAPTISNWERMIFQAGDDDIQAVARVLNVSEVYLRYGLSGQLAGDLRRGIPAGREAPIFLPDEIIHKGLLSLDGRSTVTVRATCGPGVFALLVRDDSGDDGSRNAVLSDDLVVVDPDADMLPGNLVLASIGAATAIVGRLSEFETKQGIRYEVTPPNRRFAKRRIDPAADRLLGRIIEFHRAIN